MTSSPPRLPTYDEVLALVLARAPEPLHEDVPLAATLGRHLARPVCALQDMPPWTNSAVDGYALSSADCKRPGCTLRCVGEIRAGDSPAVEIEPGTALRVFTGSALPPSAGAVVMQEDTSRAGDALTVAPPVPSGANIRLRGEEAKAGDQILEPCLVTPAVVAVLAACGCASATVASPPKVHIVTTGSETQQPGGPLLPGTIYDSNTPALVAALRALGLEPSFGHVPDNPILVERAIRAGLESDVLITTGGVSVGDHDLVRPVLKTLGAEILVEGAAIKPGKPLVFATSGNCAVFGLPGNPVSMLVTFLLFARPYLLSSMGFPAPQENTVAKLASPLAKKAGRTEFVPGRLIGGEFVPVSGRASHKTTCLASANALCVLDPDREAWQPGDEVRVTEVRWGSA